MCRFSLIVATLGRKEEVVRLLRSLRVQTYRDFEVIIIDQNSNNMLDEAVIKEGEALKIIHIKSDKKGLSYNRNIGLLQAKGEIIAFPDDDCFYSSDVLEKIDKSFREIPEHKLRLTNVMDPETSNTYIRGGGKKVKRGQLLKKAISFNIFIKRANTMLFDEKLGCGAYFGSGEESDFLFANIDKKESGLFVDSKIYHSEGKVSNRTEEQLYSYGLGWGAIFKKEFVLRNNFLSLIYFIYSLFRCLVAFVIKWNPAYLYTFKGRLKGFIKYPIHK